MRALAVQFLTPRPHRLQQPQRRDTSGAGSGAQTAGGLGMAQKTLQRLRGGKAHERPTERRVVVCTAAASGSLPEDGPEAPNSQPGGDASEPNTCSAPLSAAQAAYTEALRVVRASGAAPYVPVIQCAQVHVRLPGMQPEQLSPTWRADMEEYFAEQNWCLLSSAVRRGSIYISFTLAGTHFRRNAAAASAAAPVTPQDTDRSRAASDSAPLSDVVPVELDPDVLPGPEQFLTRVGLRSDQLPEGFSMTVQAVLDGRWYRLKYTLQPGGSWASESLGARSGGNAEGGGGQQRDGAASASNSSGYGSDLLESGGYASSCEECRSAAPAAAAAAGKQDAGLTMGPLASERPPWVMHAPLVLVGVRTSAAGSRGGGDSGTSGSCAAGSIASVASGGAAERYEATVSACPEPSYRATGDTASGAASDADASALELRVRGLGVGSQETDFTTEQKLVSSPVGIDAESKASLEEHGGGADPSAWMAHIRPGAETPTPPAERAADGSHDPAGRMHVWVLTLWERAPQAAPGTSAPHPAAPAAVATDTRNPAATAQASASPRLVDLSLWHGHELLATRVAMLVPSSASRADGSSSRRGNRPTGPGATDSWVVELQALLRAQPAGAAQSALMDIGLLLSGSLGRMSSLRGAPVALETTGTSGGAGGGEQAVTAHAAGPPVAVAAPAAMRASISGQSALFALDLGCSLLTLALKGGAVALAGRLWGSLEQLGFGAEELLLHAAGMRRELPLLHAAVVSGSHAAVSLVLRWYAAAALPEPWLQPVRMPGAPAVLTPLVLASASSPSGELLLRILRNHTHALAAWRVPVNGASGRSAAAAAGLRRVVLAADVWTALAPASAAGAALRRWFRRSQRSLRSWMRLPGRARALRPLRVVSGDVATEPGPETGVVRCGAGEQGSATPRESASPSGSSGSFASSRLWRRRASGNGADRTLAASSSEGALLWKGVGRRRADTECDLDMFIARRMRTHMWRWQLAIIAFQVISQLKFLIGAFEATCPAAAAASAAAAAAGDSGIQAWLSTTRATARCVAGRFWWTALELTFALTLGSPLGLRHHPACCAVAAALRCCFQAWEGELLPVFGMTAYGLQMVLTDLMFVAFTAYCFQAPPRLNVLLRLAEGLAASRMLMRYGVTNDVRLATATGVAINAVGWAMSSMLRRRAARMLLQRQHEQHG